MPEQRIYKSMNLPLAIAARIEGIAREERRSFTKQTEILLEEALALRPAPPAGGTVRETEFAREAV